MNEKIVALRQLNQELVKAINDLVPERKQISKTERLQIFKEIYNTGIALKLLGTGELIEEITNDELTLQETLTLLNVKEEFFKLDLMMYKDFITELSEKDS